METRTRIVNVKPTLSGADITLHIEGDLSQIDTLMNRELRLKLVQWREKRSKDANAYFFVLVDKLADVLRVSKPYIHNLMLRKYGRIQTIDGRPVWVVLPENEETFKKVEEEDTLHLKPTAEVKEGKDGRMYRTYLLLKGSHEMNTLEMNILLDGVIADCKEQGIETMTPQEISELKQRWGVEIEQHHPK